jgi:hypothetical protein
MAGWGGGGQALRRLAVHPPLARPAGSPGCILPGMCSTPDALISTSTWPTAAAACSAAAWMEASSVRSSCTTCAGQPQRRRASAPAATGCEQAQGRAARRTAPAAACRTAHATPAAAPLLLAAGMWRSHCSHGTASCGLPLLPAIVRRGAGVHRGHAPATHFVSGIASNWRTNSRPSPLLAPCTTHVLPCNLVPASAAGWEACARTDARRRALRPHRDARAMQVCVTIMAAVQ